MFNISTRVIFAFGFISGILLSLIYQKPENLTNLTETARNFNYLNCIKDKFCKRVYVPYDTLRYSGQKFVLESELLYKTVSILCLVLVVKEKNFNPIEKTWGRSCNAIKAINVKPKKKIFPIKRNEDEDSWIILCRAIRKVPNVYDWVIIVEDDTFVIIENLRRFVMFKNASEHYYIGHPTKFWNTVYNVGKAGFVLSKGVVNTMKNSTCISRISYRNREDFMLGHHLASLNISITEGLDEVGLSTFHPHNLNKILFNEDNGKNHSLQDAKCCSQQTITFNAIEGDKMYTYHYLLYSLQLFHDGHLGNQPPLRKPDEEVWQDFLRKHNLPLDISNEKYYEFWDKLIDSPDLFGRNMKREDYTDTDENETLK